MHGYGDLCKQVVTIPNGWPHRVGSPVLLNHHAGRCKPADNDAISSSGLARGVAKFPT